MPCEKLNEIYTALDSANDAGVRCESAPSADLASLDPPPCARSSSRRAARGGLGTPAHPCAVVHLLRLSRAPGGGRRAGH
eukprot:2880454-Prymnesium_polylepis.2